MEFRRLTGLRLSACFYSSLLPAALSNLKIRVSLPLDYFFSYHISFVIFLLLETLVLALWDPSSDDSIRTFVSLRLGSVLGASPSISSSRRQLLLSQDLSFFHFLY